VVSDCWAISDLHQGHGFVLTLEQAAALSVKAGTDLSCGPEFGALPLAVRNRLLSNDDIDRAVKRLFEARFRLGMSTRWSAYRGQSSHWQTMTLQRIGSLLLKPRASHRAPERTSATLPRKVPRKQSRLSVRMRIH